MKHIIITIICCTLYNMSSAQINQYDRQSYGSLSLPSFNEMAGAAMYMQAIHEQRERYLSSLVDIVTNTLSKNIDSILENELKIIYSDLKTFYNKPLVHASVYAKLQQQEIKIRDAFIRYNKRVQKQQEKEEQERIRRQEEARREAQEQAKYAPSSGTGFFLSKEGHIVTNYHVIANAKTLAITGVNANYDRLYSVSIEQVDVYNDLAILKIKDPQFKPFTNNLPYKIRLNQAEVGENCYVLGYPLISTMGADIKLTNGIISARTGFQGDVSQYQISAPLQPGNSGGPLFDSKGNIVGIVSAKHTGAENAGYAIKTSYLQNLIELLEPSISLPEHNALFGKSLPEQVKLSKNYVCIILVNVIKERENAETVENIMDKPSISRPSKRIISPVNITKQYCATTKIISIELSDKYTILNLQTTNQYDFGGWCNIDENTYITDGKNQYKMITTYNIEIAPQKTLFEQKGEILEFSLIFPQLPPNTSKIDLIETPQSPWRFYGIRLD